MRARAFVAAGLPGMCQTPTCGFNAYCAVGDGNYGENQALVCPTGDLCEQGFPLEDAGAYCPDFASPPDLTTSGADLGVRDAASGG